LDIRALTVGGWNEREGDLAAAAKILQDTMGGEEGREGGTEGKREGGEMNVINILFEIGKGRTRGRRQLGF
jgi:hypothetical protein